MTSPVGARFEVLIPDAEAVGPGGNLLFAAEALMETMPIKLASRYDVKATLAGTGGTSAGIR